MHFYKGWISPFILIAFDQGDYKEGDGSSNKQVLPGVLKY